MNRAAIVLLLSAALSLSLGVSGIRIIPPPAYTLSPPTPVPTTEPNRDLPSISNDGQIQFQCNPACQDGEVCVAGTGSDTPCEDPDNRCSVRQQRDRDRGGNARDDGSRSRSGSDDDTTADGTDGNHRVDDQEQEEDASPSPPYCFPSPRRGRGAMSCDDLECANETQHCFVLQTRKGPAPSCYTIAPSTCADVSCERGRVCNDSGGVPTCNLARPISQKKKAKSCNQLACSEEDGTVCAIVGKRPMCAVVPLSPVASCDNLDCRGIGLGSRGRKGKPLGRDQGFTCMVRSGVAKCVQTSPSNDTSGKPTKPSRPRPTPQPKPSRPTGDGQDRPTPLFKPTPRPRPTSDGQDRPTSGVSRPVRPTGKPSRPTGETEATRPSRPTGQTRPTRPSSPTGETEPTRPSRPTGQTRPTTPSSPTGQTDPTRPSRPTGQTRPTRPPPPLARPTGPTRPPPTGGRPGRPRG